MDSKNKIEVAIRLFQAGDEEDLSRLIIENLEQVNVQNYGKSAVRQLVRQYSPAHILKYATYGEMYVAEAPGEPSLAGTVTLEDERVRNLFVRNDLRGQSIGKRLMLFIESVAREKGLTRLYLLADLTAADFYESLGYVRKGERLELIRSARFKMVEMEKDLPAVTLSDNT